MQIKIAHLYRANPRNVLRLAHYVGLTTFGRTMEDIMQELHIRINF
jgi:hypothetical protein